MKTGDIVRVRVVEVDMARSRIALTMKLDAPAACAAPVERQAGATRPTQHERRAEPQGVMAAAFARLKR